VLTYNEKHNRRFAMIYSSIKKLAVVLTVMGIGSTATVVWAQEAQEGAAAEGPAAGTEAAPAVESQQGANEEETASSTATAVVVPPGPYSDILSQPPSRWDDLVDERRDALAERRRERLGDYTRGYRYWHRPWDAVWDDIRDEYRDARREWSRERSRYYRDLADVQRRYYSPWTAARSDWYRARSAARRLAQLEMQERFEDMMYGAGPYRSGPWYPGGFGPFGGFPGAGPWVYPFAGYGMVTAPVVVAPSAPAEK
jgi:hypothetical protein